MNNCIIFACTNIRLIIKRYSKDQRNFNCQKHGHVPKGNCCKFIVVVLINKEVCEKVCFNFTTPVQMEVMELNNKVNI